MEETHILGESEIIAVKASPDERRSVLQVARANPGYPLVRGKLEHPVGPAPLPEVLEHQPVAVDELIELLDAPASMWDELRRRTER